MPTPDDYRGSFYRVVAPRSATAVMQKVDVADRRFTNAISGDANFLLQSPPAVPSLDMVIVHGGFGGCSSVGEALRAAKRLSRSALPHADTGFKPEDRAVAGRQQ